MSKSSFLIAILLSILCTILFLAYPSVDIKVAHHFYIHNHDFILLDRAWARGARIIQNYALIAFGLILMISFILKILIKGFAVKLKSLIYIFVVFMIVPVVLINGVLKDNFHRPRPREIVQFAGTMKFKRVWTVTGECDNNCSFVCGDAAAVFAFWALFPFVRRRWKLLYGTSILLLGGFYGFIRVGQGAHFLSDAIFAALLSYIFIWLIYWFFYRYAPAWLDEKKLESICWHFQVRLKRLVGLN